VKSCQPALEAVQDIVDELNASNDFFGFVLAMREGFKATVTPPA